MRQKIILSISKKEKIIVLMASVNIFISVLMAYFLFFVDSVQEVYGPDEYDRYLRDTQVFWLVTIVVIVYLVVEVIATLSRLKRNSKLEQLIYVIVFLHLIAQTYFSVRYFWGYIPNISPLVLTLIIDSLLLLTFSRKLNNEI